MNESSYGNKSLTLLVLFAKKDSNSLLLQNNIQYKAF